MGGTSPFGTIGDVILGMVGAAVGGYIVALFGVSGTGGIIGSIVVALPGAMLIIRGPCRNRRFPAVFRRHPACGHHPRAGVDAERREVFWGESGFCSGYGDLQL